MKRVSATEAGVAVVATLMLGSVGYPLLAQGKARGARSTCLGNMKQIGASVMMYAADCDAVLPRTSEERPKLGLGAHWTYVVQPYVRSASLFVCPSRPEQEYVSLGSVDTRRRVPRLGYVNNYAAIPAHDFYPVPTFALTDPAGLILLGERRSEAPSGLKMRGWKGTSGFRPGQPCSDQEFGRQYIRTTGPIAEASLRRATSDKDLLLIRLDWTAHGEVSNYTFADGHARPERLRETLEPSRFQWGERFYARSMPDAECDGHPHRRRNRP